MVSKTCHKCLAASELLAHSYAEIYISAAKEAEVSIEGLASGGRDEDDYTIIHQHLVEKTMVAFAQVWWLLPWSNMQTAMWRSV